MHFKRIWHMVLAAQLPALICGLLTFIALQVVISNTEHATKNEEQARIALKYSLHTSRVLMRGLVSVGGYLETGREEELTGFHETAAALDGVSAQLKSLSDNFPAERETVGALRQLAQDFRVRGQEAIVLKKLGTNVAPWRLAEIQTEIEDMATKWTGLASLLDEQLEQQLQRSPMGTDKSLGTLAVSMLMSLACTLVACVFTSRMLNKQICQRLELLRDNEQRMSENLPLHQPLEGEDELATLDKEFHAMSASLAELTAREREILETATDMILTVDEELAIQSANDAARKFARGIELPGRSVLQLVAPAAVPSLRRFFDNCRGAAQPDTTEIVLSQSGDDESCASLSAQWSESSNLYSCVLHDISERRRLEKALRASEQHLDEMLHDMPAGVLLVDENCRVDACNEIAAAALGFSKSDILGRDIKQLMTIKNDGHQLGFTALKKLVGESCLVVPLSESERSSHLQLSVQSVETDNERRFVLVLLDVSVIENVRTLNAQLLETISQAVIQPLNQINQTIFALKSATAVSQSPRASKFLTIGSLESERLLKLFDELLQIERSDIDQMVIDPRPTSVQELLERCAAITRLSAEKQGVRVETQPTDLVVCVDPGRITQVIINLISNALKFTKRGGYIKMSAESIDSQMAAITVMDSGCGIPAGMEKAIFEPFKQSRASDALEKGGSGLGLFICKSIVEKHGGTIIAANHSDGALFRLTLPVARD